MPLLAPRAKSTTRKRMVNTVITIAAIALAALVVTTTADAAKKKKPAPLPANSVTSKQIKNASVTAPKLASSAVTSIAIKDGTITAADLAAGVVPATLVGATAGGALTGTFPNPTLAASVVTSANILDGAGSVADLAAGAVTSATIADGTIATEDIADSAITGDQLAANAVEAVDIANDAVTAGKIAAGAVKGETLNLPAFSGRPALLNNPVSDNTSPFISLAAEHWDTADLHDEVVNPTRVIAPVTGVYRVWAHVLWTSGTAGLRTLTVVDKYGGSLFGDETPVNASGSTRQTVSAEVCLLEDEYVRYAAGVTSNGGDESIQGIESSFGMSLVTPVSTCV